jgi:hypothetical protein
MDSNTPQLLPLMGLDRAVRGSNVLHLLPLMDLGIVSHGTEQFSVTSINASGHTPLLV